MKKTRQPRTKTRLHRLAVPRELYPDVDQQAVDLALVELGMHAPLSEIVRRAQSIKQAIIQSRVRRGGKQLC
jgi:hypothetical protein